MRRKRRSTIIKNIESVNMEIDYDKLAEAIVKAEDNAKKKQEKTINILTIAMAICNFVIYFFVFYFLVFALDSFWKTDADGTSEIIAKIVLLIITLILLVITFCLMVASIQKGEAEKHFNANMTLAALIIALIALFQSNGSEEIIPYLEDIKNLLMN